MALFVVATPIGNPQDFTLRALELLGTADLIIGEEMKVLRQTLKAAGVQAKTLELLNEHSREADVEHYVNEAKTKKVVLVSDCGTPGFCDPGADLVAACSKAGIAVHPAPGASSLMSLLSICGVRLDTFLFHGFLPAKNEDREKAWKTLSSERRAFIVMETPYRAEKLIQDLAKNFAGRRIIIGLNLTQENERVIRARGKELPALGPFPDAEPIVLVLPD